MRYLLVAVLLASSDNTGWERKEFDCKRPSSCDEENCCQYGLAVYTREKAGVDVRLKVNTGSWTFEPLGSGKRSLAIYQLLTDPGGSIPKFMANRANTTALPELFARVRKRAEGK